MLIEDSIGVFRAAKRCVGTRYVVEVNNRKVEDLKVDKLCR